MQSPSFASARRRVGLAFCMITLFTCAALMLSRSATPTDLPLTVAIGGSNVKGAQVNDTPVDERHRQMVIGTWHDQYEGKRTLTVRPDGTATMIIEFDGYKARLFTPRLQIETTWAIDAGRFNRQTVGGEPADKVEFVKRRVGDRASDRIVQISDARMTLLDQDGETKYEWRRAR